MEIAQKAVAVMFPTHVGMNRTYDMEYEKLTHVPHTRGDEPMQSGNFVLSAPCSPHTWG